MSWQSPGSLTLHQWWMGGLGISWPNSVSQVPCSSDPNINNWLPAQWSWRTCKGIIDPALCGSSCRTCDMSAYKHIFLHHLTGVNPALIWMLQSWFLPSWGHHPGLGCPTVALSHQCVIGASKHATNQKPKALFNWEIFAKHDKLSLSDISMEIIFWYKL